MAFIEAEPRSAPSGEARPASANGMASAGGDDRRLVKASFNLPADELANIKALAERRGTTATQVVRQALSTEFYLQRLVDDGYALLAKKGRRAREIVFSHMGLA
jgi:hypothetical protein